MVIVAKRMGMRVKGARGHLVMLEGTAACLTASVGNGVTLAALHAQRPIDGDVCDTETSADNPSRLVRDAGGGARDVGDMAGDPGATGSSRPASEIENATADGTAANGPLRTTTRAHI
jgi:hypothetical protein